MIYKNYYLIFTNIYVYLPN